MKNGVVVGEIDRGPDLDRKNVRFKRLVLLIHHRVVRLMTGLDHSIGGLKIDDDARVVLPLLHGGLARVAQLDSSSHCGGAERQEQKANTDTR